MTFVAARAFHVNHHKHLLFLRFQQTFLPLLNSTDSPTPFQKIHKTLRITAKMEMLKETVSNMMPSQHKDEPTPHTGTTSEPSTGGVTGTNEPAFAQSEPTSTSMGTDTSLSSSGQQSTTGSSSMPQSEEYSPTSSSLENEARSRESAPGLSSSTAQSGTYDPSSSTAGTGSTLTNAPSQALRSEAEQPSSSLNDGEANIPTSGSYETRPGPIGDSSLDYSAGQLNNSMAPSNTGTTGGNPLSQSTTAEPASGPIGNSVTGKSTSELNDGLGGSSSNAPSGLNAGSTLNNSSSAPLSGPISNSVIGKSTEELASTVQQGGIPGSHTTSSTVPDIHGTPSTLSHAPPSVPESSPGLMGTGASAYGSSGTSKENAVELDSQPISSGGGASTDDSQPIGSGGSSESAVGSQAIGSGGPGTVDGSDSMVTKSAMPGSFDTEPPNYDNSAPQTTSAMAPEVTDESPMQSTQAPNVANEPGASMQDAPAATASETRDNQVDSFSRDIDSAFKSSTNLEPTAMDDENTKPAVPPKDTKRFTKMSDPSYASDTVASGPGTKDNG